MPVSKEKDRYGDAVFDLFTKNKQFIVQSNKSQKLKKTKKSDKKVDSEMRL